MLVERKWYQSKGGKEREKMRRHYDRAQFRLNSIRRYARILTKYQKPKKNGKRKKVRCETWDEIGLIQPVARKKRFLAEAMSGLRTQV